MSHQEHHHLHQGTDETSESALAELVDLDAEVLHSYLSEVTGWICALAGGRPPHRLIDLGSGTGTGTFALLERFGAAEAIAVDLSAEMLRRVTGKADVLGLADRVRTVQADLDAAWPAVAPRPGVGVRVDASLAIPIASWPRYWPPAPGGRLVVPN